MSSTSTYHFPSPASHGTGLSPTSTYTGVTTDPTGTDSFAHLSIPFDTADQHTALALTHQVESPAYAATRVMSPNDQSSSSLMLQANQSVLLGMQGTCQVCNMMVPDPSLCANCGVFGHAICIGAEFFQGYAFCKGCMPQILMHYTAMSDQHLRQQ